MTDPRPCFARPIEHVQDGSGVDFSVGGTDYVISTGTYANVISLARSLVLAATEITDLRMSSTYDGFIELYSTSTATLSWTNTYLRNALGFTSSVSLTASSWSAANNLSPYVWIPHLQKADQTSFGKRSEDYFRGAVGLTGSVSGMSTGCSYSRRTIQFNLEYATNLGEEFATTQAQSDGCLDNFVMGAMTRSASVSTNQSPLGFWFYDDINAFIADCTATGSEWQTDGGVQWDFGDTYCFCQFDPENAKSEWKDTPALPVSRLMYNVKLNFHTAPAPSFL
jgi:hypothetical protein